MGACMHRKQGPGVKTPLPPHRNDACDGQDLPFAHDRESWPLGNQRVRLYLRTPLLRLQLYLVEVLQCGLGDVQVY